MLRFNKNATHASHLRRSILSVRFNTRPCGEETLLFSKFMNIVMIPIFSWYTCFEICLARRQFVESHLVGFRVCYQHALVQVLCTVSAAVALRDVFFNLCSSTDFLTLLFLSALLVTYLLNDREAEARILNVMNLTIMILFFFLWYFWI